MGNNIVTKYYQKPTNSGKYLNFHSSQPLAHKRGVVISLVDRAIHLTSPKFRQDILHNIKSILITNNYPPKFIHKIIKQRLHKFYNKSKFTKPNNININPKYICLPYVEGLSQKLNKIFSPYNIKLAHKTSNNLNCIFTKLKDKIPHKKQTHLIYKISYPDCNQVYIGQTIQYLEERLNGHKYAKNKTALKKHINNTGHNFDFDNTKILIKETNNKARNVHEMIQIKKHHNAVNDKTEVGNLSKIYYSILK